MFSARYLYGRDDLLRIRSMLDREKGSSFWDCKCSDFAVSWFQSYFSELRAKDSGIQVAVVFFSTGSRCGRIARRIASLLRNGKICHCDIFAVPETVGDQESLNQQAECLKNRLLQMHRDTPESFCIAVDALLGMEEAYDDASCTGSLRAVFPFFSSSTSELFNFRIALDVPSGLDAHSGCASARALKADVTLSFSPYPLGFFVGQSADYCGQLVFGDILTGSMFCSDSVAEFYDYADARKLPSWPKRDLSANKNDSGKLFFAGGGYGMPGAVRLAAEAALRSGAGLVRVGACNSSLPLIFSGRPELMLCDLDCNELFSPENWADALGMGPGLGRDDWAQRIYERYIDLPQPKVVDADALYFLSQKIHLLRSAVITPHEMEAARLLHTSVEYLRSNRLNCLKELSGITGAVTVLKGHFSMICHKDQVFVCGCGCSAMATGGMGDTLCGIITSLLAGNISPLDAALIGTAVHGRAGELAGMDGCMGTLPSDLMEKIRSLINGLDDKTIQVQNSRGIVFAQN